MDMLKQTDPDVYRIIQEEIKRQQNNIELVASENYCSKAVLEAQGSVMTNKYAEGYPDKRWYAGCGNVDDVEKLAIERALDIFGAEHANVQPHSGSSANMAVFFAALSPGHKILSMDLSHGGHLTHGFEKNFSGQFYQKITYGVKQDTGRIDYDEVRELAKKSSPDLIIAGASAYPRELDFAKFKEIADEVGALLLADIAHIAGLIVAGVHPDPVPHADFVTTSTHKTLRGPRAGLILCKSKYASKIDQLVFPGIQGGPLMHIIAAKAVAFKEAKTEDFKDYQRQILKNAKTLSNALKDKGYTLVSGGTDNHLFLVDLSNKNVKGIEAQKILEKAGISLNRNMIPFDGASAFNPSGIRIGTPSVTTRGMKESEMIKIADWIDLAINTPDDQNLALIKGRVTELCADFPLYKDY
ncbi:MAG: serine hydroxymethyltransferase [Candidatus Scalindua sp. AMX11]|nr:MAG: serine hydroxymethyltransferase [Candidatus Scalindua sp.]RZV88021.1 MAG: serine hydroxymethyltransferase [Candidatus Scalindua sp. SCAELEC01]TDE64169.1 MAG: serine hydroxymethyltransferase [Candidatus Scalindua sp. AMX11]GJQ58401.1 MAG: serine hydroxymethyltransferase [Candidatus Scalindua sp.]